MKTIFWILWLVAFVIFTTGCTGYRFHLFPTAEIIVFNDCPGSVVDIESVRGEHGTIGYGEKKLVVLERYMGRDYSILLTALDVSPEKRGSTSQSFSTSQNSSREYAWHVQYLRGGVGCGRLR